MISEELRRHFNISEPLIKSSVATRYFIVVRLLQNTFGTNMSMSRLALYDALINRDDILSKKIINFDWS